MNDIPNADTEREEKFVKLYMHLSGASESLARSVFMHVCCHENQLTGPTAEAIETGWPVGRLVEDSFVEQFPSASTELQVPTASLAPA